MPKQVDHEQRHRLITGALWRIAADSGLEAASLSQIAAEAGVSKGMVQHYFSSKEELFAAATSELKARVEQRLWRSLRTGPRPTTPSDTLGAVLFGLLPTDEESRIEALVENAFFIRALKQPDVADRFREGRVQLLTLLADYIRSGQRTGELNEDLDADNEAEVLLALVGGLGESLLLGHHTAAGANSVLQYHLTRMSTGDRPDHVRASTSD